jgi:hypothetical protein
LFALVSAPAFAVKSAQSTALDINPSISYFKAVAAHATADSASISVENIGSNEITISNVSLSDGDVMAYSVVQNNCTGTTLAAGEACDIEVSYQPDSRGYKQAILNVHSDAPDTPILQAFLTSKEGRYRQASRRLPPVLYAVNVPETLTSGQTYTLEWTLLGYHDDYMTSMVMFDCTGVTNGTCGSNYSDDTKFYETGAVTSHANLTSSWSYDDVYAKEFKYQAEFTPDFSSERQIVIRFYRLNSDDQQAGTDGLSLLIPGNLAASYYDKEGRRLQKKIVP